MQALVCVPVSFPVLWIAGAPGVGKSTVGWELFRGLDGTAGYVDIDQLGMCYPESPADPGRHRLKAANLGAVVRSFRSAGARALVVSGVLDRAHTPRPAGVDLTVCALRSEPGVLRARLVRRGLPAQAAEEMVRAGQALEDDFADMVIETGGLPVAEVVRLVREKTGWPPAPGRPADVAAAEVRPGPPGRAVWLCGATGSGKSTVGWQVYQQVMRAGRTAAFVDLDQIGMVRPAPADDPLNHRVKSRVLAAIWTAFAASGASYLVVNGPVHDAAGIATYRAALPALELTVVRLHAGPDELAARIAARGRGGSWAAPGDPLRDQPPEVLRRVAADAASEADALERIGLGDVRVDTDGRTPEAVAAEVLRHT
jgi:broad-specificity NMP kinase/gluconate kinase